MNSSSAACLHDAKLHVETVQESPRHVTNRKAQWLANALGASSCAGSLAGWVILVSTYIRLQSVPDFPGPNGLTRNLHTLIGAGYLFLLLQVVAAVLLVLALIPSRDRRKTLPFGLPLAPCAIGLCILLLLNIAR